MLLCGLLPHYIFANTPEIVSQKIKDVNAQIEALDREIKQYQSQISETNQQSNTLSNLIKELTLTRAKLLKETKQTEKKITATNIVISTLTDDIGERQKSINNSESAMNKMLRDLQLHDNDTFVEKVLSKESFSDMNIEYNNTVSVNDKLRAFVLDIKKEKEELELSKDQKQSEQQKLSKLKSSLVQQKVAVDITKKAKDTLLKETKNKESNYKKLLAERERQRDFFEKSLEEYEAQLKFILNPKSLPARGALSWPVENVRITSVFGPRWGRFHYGTDFRASVGTPVKAMASGEVLGTGDTDIACKGASFGKWVFIRHSNGLSSVYGHLSAISITTGQKVAVGDVIALSGNTGSSTGPHLHVGVYASDGVKVDTVPSKSCNGKIFTQPIAALNAYLDPMLYLPKQ